MPDYFYTMSVNTSGQPCGAQVGTTTQICGNCQVLEGEQHSSNHGQPLPGVDTYTRPFSRDCHGCHDIHVVVTKWP